MSNPDDNVAAPPAPGSKSAKQRQTKPPRALKVSQAFSPELDGNCAIFRLHAPQAALVELALNYPFTQRVPMTRDQDGTWSLTSAPLAAGLYPYFFFLDGVAIADPANPDMGRRINVGYSLLDVPGQPPRIDQRRPVPHGIVHRHDYFSSTLAQDRRLWVYTPPGFDPAGDERLPCLYLRHGAEQVEDSWLAAGRADVMLDNLLAEGRAPRLILVMTNGYAIPQAGGLLRQDRNAPSAVALLGQELVAEVIPLIEAHYAVATDRRARAIAGLSMGAGHALLIGLAQLAHFSTIGCFSSGVLSGPDFDLATRAQPLVNRPDAVNAALDQLWFGCGSDDRRSHGHRTLMEQLSALGVRHSYREVPGSHEWRAWRPLLAQFLTSLWPQRNQHAP